MNGQFFDGVKVFCYFVAESVYQSRVGVWAWSKKSKL